MAIQIADERRVLAAYPVRSTEAGTGAAACPQHLPGQATESRECVLPLILTLLEKYEVDEQMVLGDSISIVMYGAGTGWRMDRHRRSVHQKPVECFRAERSLVH